MNRTRLLRLPDAKREKEIYEFLESHPIQDLRHYASCYGINNPKTLTKGELLDALVAGMNLWAEIQVVHE